MGSSKIATIIAIVLSVLVGGSAYALRAKQSGGGPADVHFESLPLQFGNYAGQEGRFDPATYTVLGADTTTLRRYNDPFGNSLWLFVAYFGEQNYGQQIHSPRHCLPGGGWRIDTHERIPVAVPGLGEILTNRMLIGVEGKKQVMYYFFVTRVGFTPVEFRLKLHLAQAALSFQPRDAAFVRITVPISGNDTQTADKRAQAFMAEAIPLLLGGLPF